MDPNAAEPPPGCLVILTPLAAAMADDARVWLAHRVTPEGEPEIRDVPKALAARFLADELIEGLVNTLDAGYAVPLDLAVIGYQTDEIGEPRLVSLLPGDNPAVRLVPLSEVAVRAVEPRSREGDPRKWTANPECSGSAPAAVALAEVYHLVSMWLTGRFAARPPVIVHCTTGEGLDEAYQRVARSLGLLTTAYGPARLLHVGFAPDVEPALCGTTVAGVCDPGAEPASERPATEEPGSQTPATEEPASQRPAATTGLPEPWASLRDLSAELPAEAEGRPARRAVSVNDWAIADAWSAIFDHTPPADAVAWMEGDAGRFEPSFQALWAQKMGNEPDQWEDAHATNATAGVAAVADGASTGIYCRTWADQLARHFVADRPDVRDPVALAKWVHGLRVEWRATIEYETLNWSKQRKVDEVGAAATLLGLEVGPPDAAGRYQWRACAIGDASLFWVRGGRLLATFPIVAADQFGSAPMLVRSNHGFKTLAVFASGVCEPGDRFLLATDAVAARLFKSAASGPGPDWERFESLDQNAWRAELDELRRANDMVNDDCTLVALRVVGGESVPLLASGGRQPPDDAGDETAETNDAVSEQASGGRQPPDEPRPDESGGLRPPLAPETDEMDSTGQPD